MEIGEAVAAGESNDEELQPTRGFRLVDIHGTPLSNLEVELSSGAQKQTDGDGVVEDDALEGGVGVKTKDGRRVIFGFRYYQPLRHDPGWMQHSLEDFDDAKRNGMFEDEDDVEDTADES